MKRAAAVFRLELAHTLSRPLFVFLVALLLLLSLGLSRGNVTIASGDASVGGTKAWITSEFAFAFVLSTLVGLLYAFFLAIASGLAVVQDDEWKVSELLHATALSPREYVWGKFLAVLGGFGVALGIHLLFAMVFNQLVPNPHTAEIRGPFELANYLRPALVFAAPALVFFAGVAFYIGERTRRPLLVFLFPLALFLLSAFFLWEWSPSWLDPRINRVLMLVDPTGHRWLNETWLRLDRGARFYNTARIGLDGGFLASRAVFLGLGLSGVWLAERGLARRLRGERSPIGRRAEPGLAGRRDVAGAMTADAMTADAAAGLPATDGSPLPPLASLGMRSRPPALWSGSLPVARAELRNLFGSPGIYIFGVLILLETILDSAVALGPFDTEVLVTPGYLAATTLGYLSALLCPLLMFYTVESIERDRSTGLDAISLAAPTSTSSLLLGKGAANGVLAAAMMAITFAGCAAVLLIQRQVPLAVGPFLGVWGLLLVPTLLLWTAFVVAVQTLFARRAVTYGLCLAVLAFTGYRAATGRINWVGNWPLWNAVRWSDLGPFEIDRRALILSRLAAVGLAAFCAAVAVQASRRRESDAIGTLHRLQPRPLARRALRLAPFAVVPLVAGTLLWVAVLDGFEGEVTKKRQKDYWKQNLGTWRDAPIPAFEAVDLDVTLEPEQRRFHTHGTYRLWNDRAAALPRFAMTVGPHSPKVTWTLDGKPYRPADRTGLYVIAPPTPLAPGGRLSVGFDYAGALPEGISKNGSGQVAEFILPSGVVLTSFNPTFTPMLGFVEELGVDKDNRYEPRVYPPDYYLGRTDAAFGSNSPFTTRIQVTAPAAYTINSVGVLESDRVAEGRRTVVWRSDQPVRFFNVVAGRWQVRRGNGTAIYYDRRHPYNIAAMSRALDAARLYYSRWFYPYPWRELKLSEYAAHTFSAQGFPTDITFSEGIGFLTKHDLETDAVFVVTAHEAAHQWWGNLITPGKGPGGNLLSEGMSHFSALLLTEQVKGIAGRIELAKRLEERYGRNRHPDAEHPLVEIDGSRSGDTTVTYDKGGWVFWMLLQHLGRDRALAGLRRFIADWKDSSDHPVLQDFVAAMRPFAADPGAYDAFVRQWFFSVVVPEYQLAEARKRRLAGEGAAGKVGMTVAPGGSAGAAGSRTGVAGAASAWEVTVKVKNAGTGRMPVEVAAVRGRRFDPAGKPLPAYREARATVLLGAGEERQVSLRCPFEPDTVLVDPDALVLQLRRKVAAVKL